jgi:hypothetical protein
MPLQNVSLNGTSKSVIAIRSCLISLHYSFKTYSSFCTFEHRAPLNFDVFSTGLVFCQLLFNLLDDRTDAGFRQQLEDADFDMDLWLEREFQATLRPVSEHIF